MSIAHFFFHYALPILLFYLSPFILAFGAIIGGPHTLWYACKYLFSNDPEKFTLYKEDLFYALFFLGSISFIAFMVNFFLALYTIFFFQIFNQWIPSVLRLLHAIT
jgi:hypothetical protein